jgi:hypothetical protein
MQRRVAAGMNPAASATPSQAPVARVEGQVVLLPGISKNA